jgi:hypothetical protein
LYWNRLVSRGDSGREAAAFRGVRAIGIRDRGFRFCAQLELE